MGQVHAETKLSEHETPFLEVSAQSQAYTQPISFACNLMRQIQQPRGAADVCAPAEQSIHLNRSTG
jgi:hypothetical protein